MMAGCSKSMFLVIGGACLLLSAMACTGFAQTAVSIPEVSSDEYTVYNAVLDDMEFPNDDVHVLIFNRTVAFGCGDYSSGIPLVNNCSFLAISPQTSAQVEELLRTNWPKMSSSTWSDFAKVNATSAKLQDSLKTSWKHMLDGAGMKEKGGKEWNSPDFEFFFSRVGFDSTKTEALVFVLLFSYADNVRSGGDYFRLQLNKDKRWDINGRVRYFEKQPDQTN